MSTTKLHEFLKTAKDLLSSYKFSNIQLTDKSLVQFQGEELKKGLAVNLLIDSKPSPLPDGSYKTLNGVSFTISKGVISDLIDVQTTTSVKTTPTLQAQSSQKVENGFDTSAVPTSTAQVPASGSIKQADDQTTTTADDDATATDELGPITSTDLAAALKPLIDSIKNIESTLCNEMKAQTEEKEKMSKELKDTREALNSVTEVVEVLANIPDGKAIEPKKNQFKIEKKVEFKDSEAYKIFHVNDKKTS